MHDELIEYLQEYIRIDTTNPPGNTARAAQFFQNIFEKEGIAVKLPCAEAGTGRVNVLAKLPSKNNKEKAIVLLNHIDVVPVDRSTWKLDPFGGEIRDGALWGRGAIDMKSMGIMEMMAMIKLKREKVQLDRPVVFMGVCDEETGGASGTSFLLDNYLSEINPWIVWDEGGFISQGVFTSDKTTVFGVSVAEKQALWLKLSCQGPGGHGSMPENGYATKKLTQAINKILAWQENLANQGNSVLTELKACIKNLSENPYTMAMQNNTVSLTSFVAGVGNPPKVNIIPSHAEATLDCRLLPDYSVKKFLEELRHIISDDGVQIEVINPPVQPAVSPSDHYFFQAVKEASSAFYSEAKIAPILLPGATDSRFFRAKGIPGYGFCPIMMKHEDIALIHAPNERISVKSVKEGFDLFSAILQKLVRSS